MRNLAGCLGSEKLLLLLLLLLFLLVYATRLAYGV
jgi:hypothetical protein